MSGKSFLTHSRHVHIAFAVSAILCIFFATGSAQKISLTLQDAPLTILKSSSTTRKINGIPTGTPGLIELRIKWHVMTFIPNTFNILKVELMHGTRVLATNECYSIHAVPNPRCIVFTRVDQNEASAAGDWKLRITNNTGHDVNGFNIRKESTDLNPLVPSIVTTFEPDCSVRNLSVSEFEVATNGTVRGVILGIPNRAGAVQIRAKWHTDVLTPNIFNPLSVSILRDGTLVTADYGHSIHSDNRDKIDIRFTVAPLLNGSSSWAVEVNNRYLKIKQFGIEKGSDSNPFVPQFRSTFTPACS